MSPYQILYGSVPKQSWDWQHLTSILTPTDKLNHKDALALATRMHAAWDTAKQQMEKA